MNTREKETAKMKKEEHSKNLQKELSRYFCRP
jgi:hypothetical protein